jgi:hypothetical protein
MTAVHSVLAAIREFLNADFPHYTETLQAAFSEVDPLFIRPKYSSFFWHCSTTVPGWLPHVLLASAKAESEGSLELLNFWQCVHNFPEAETWVLTHAKDESRHSRLFIKLINLAYPKFFNKEELTVVKNSLSVIGKEQTTKSEINIDDDLFMNGLMQVNIGEIRTRLHMHLLAPVFYNMTPKENQPEVGRLLEGLEHDEVRHIAYTVEILETWARNGGAKRMRETYRDRLHVFHRRTLRETEGAVASYGQGLFPELFEI